MRTWGAVAAGIAGVCLLVSTVNDVRAGDGAVGVSLSLREDARRTGSGTVSRSRFRVEVEAAGPSVATAHDVALHVGGLRVSFALNGSRPGGVSSTFPGDVRIRAVRRGERLHVEIRGRSTAAGGAVYAHRLLDAFEWWNGPQRLFRGVEAAALLLDGVDTRLALGFAGRGEALDRFDDAGYEPLLRVSVTAGAFAPSAPQARPIVQFVPSLPGERWVGRVRGHVLAIADVAPLTRRLDGGAPEPIETWDRDVVLVETGYRDRPREGVVVAEAGGVLVHHAWFDTAVPAAAGPHAVTIACADGIGRRRAAHRRFVAPELVAPSSMDGDLTLFAVRPDGAVWGWGGNLFGALGVGHARDPLGMVRLRGPADVRSVAGGGDFGVAADRRGDVWLWGDWSRVRQPREGLYVEMDVWPNVPTRVHGLSGIVSVAAGEDHALALDRDGRVWAWGINNDGQLGDGTWRNRTWRPVRASGLPRIQSIAAGWTWSAALGDDGSVWTWGRHLRATRADVVPVRVDGLPPARAIALDGETLALAQDGTVWSFSAESAAQLPGIDDVVAVDAGDFHALALRRDGTVWTWGDTGLVPQPVRGLDRVVSITAATFSSYAVTDDGSLWAWGDYPFQLRTFGARRDQETAVPTLVPVWRVPGLEPRAVGYVFDRAKPGGARAAKLDRRRGGR